MPTEQGYRDYLANKSDPFAESTISNYCSALRRIFEHKGIPPFSLADEAELALMLEQYSQGGIHADIGSVYASSGRSALREWYHYVQSEHASLTITLTQGAIDNGYISIPREQTLFPDECIEYEQRPAQQLFNLQLPDGRVEQTRLLNKYSRIQARFNALFKQVGLREGDKVQLTRLDPYRYQMRFLKNTETAEQPEAVSLPVSTPRKDADMANAPLNQILFGPPGTGKTYNTINHALAILDPEFLTQHQDGSDTARKALKTRFDELVKAGRIDFVTFHQSFSYEDFVEGIRAQTNSHDQLEYEIKPGVFKELCNAATTSDIPVTTGIRSEPRIWKISINGTADTATRRYCFEHNEARIGWGKTGDLTNPDIEKNAYYQSLGSNDRSSLSSLSQEMVTGDIVICIRSVEQIEAIGVVSGPYRFEQEVPSDIREDYQHVRPVNWLYTDVGLSILQLNGDTQFTQKTIYPLTRFKWGELLLSLQQSGKQPLEAAKLASVDGKKPYVLIIDEINRGNISRIFGELITLIEPSKRTGAIEELNTTLPYSKKRFSVPDNLYLIGTMNTADRSLAGLDIALRRRFTFVEMPPKPELLKDTDIDGLNIGKLLEVMNQRIEVLLDRDHCLGHAYFLPLKQEQTLDKLASIFRNQILPLLQEYFFEDWERINWVLNGHRAKNKSLCFIKQPDGDNQLSQLFGEKLLEQLQDKRWQINEAAFGNIESYHQILQGE
ncbi:AAA family ATPase [Aeromonas caviae]|uniref:AAA family ATPase n=1 Tax=Aeromonas caviae TaxID=648 RepID=UPI00244CFC49|nr:AAA family ATPase [Aeromonas caviae]MDH1994062.1 AAA family ATPase [Aeromonas caviae]